MPIAKKEFRVLDLLKTSRRHQTGEAAAAAEILLSHVLGVKRKDIYLVDSVTENQKQNFSRLANERAKSSKPIAYLLGTQEFMGLKFKVKAKTTFIPRPETESLVEFLLREITREAPLPSASSLQDLVLGPRAAVVHPPTSWMRFQQSVAGCTSRRWGGHRGPLGVPPFSAKGGSASGGGRPPTPPTTMRRSLNRLSDDLPCGPNKAKMQMATEPTAMSPIRILDIGTGCGCVGLSLWHYLHESLNVHITLTDVSKSALKIAEQNAHRFKVPADSIHIIQGTWPDTKQKFHLIVSNPPYVNATDCRRLPKEIRDWEPREALLGGQDGLDVIREIVVGSKNRLAPRGILALEMDPRQAIKIRQIMLKNSYKEIGVVKDLEGRDRIIHGRL